MTLQSQGNPTTLSLARDINPPCEAGILVVDDCPIDRSMARELLRRGGFSSVESVGSGEEALGRIPELSPSLVVSDIDMPGMDGLELIDSMREQFPLIPVVLITSRGSEELAVDGLKRGAASYVPKQVLADRLPDTCHQAISVAGEQKQRKRLWQYCEQTTATFVLENDVDLIAPLVGTLQQSAQRRFGLGRVASTRLGIALSEAVRNAIDHGNLELDSELRQDAEASYYELGVARREMEPYCNRRVRVSVVETPDEVEYTICDEGPGFDTTRVNYDPRDADNVDRPSGRGLFLMRMFMSSLCYNNVGNELTMTFRPGQLGVDDIDA